MRKLRVALLLVIVAVVAGGYAALEYATDVPGQSHQGPLPRLSDDERALAATLKRHIEIIAAAEHNTS
jgi:hypothetical protein